MNDNTQITLRGRIGTDPELRTSQKGTQWTRFRVAVPVSYKDKQGSFVELDPRWYTVRAWGRLAASAASSLKKGDAVVVLGHPTAEAWLGKEGEVNSALTVTARAIGPDLTFTSVRVLRADKPAEKTNQNGTQTPEGQPQLGSWGAAGNSEGQGSGYTPGVNYQYPTATPAVSATQQYAASPTQYSVQAPVDNASVPSTHADVDEQADQPEASSLEHSDGEPERARELVGASSGGGDDAF